MPPKENTEVETSTKKLTANAVLKEFNLTPMECKELLTQIYDELEKNEDKNEEPA